MTNYRGESPEDEEEMDNIYMTVEGVGQFTFEVDEFKDVLEAIKKTKPAQKESIHVRVVKCRGLKPMDRGGTSDPFVTVEVSLCGTC